MRFRVIGTGEGSLMDDVLYFLKRRKDIPAWEKEVINLDFKSKNAEEYSVTLFDGENKVARAYVNTLHPYFFANVSVVIL